MSTGQENDNNKESGQNTTGQSGASLILLASLLDEPNPVGVPLTAKYKKGFAHKTIGYRLPVILTKVIDQLSRDKNEIGDTLGPDARIEVKTIVGALAKLKNEMQTNKTISKTNCPIWNSSLENMAETYFNGATSDVKWYFAPWLFVECYMYKRFHDAFQSTIYLKSHDIFRKQKEESWLQSVNAAAVLGEFVESAQPTDDNLQKFLEISLWGNRCDLSISSGEENSQSTNLVDQLAELKKFILCDESSKFWEVLNNSKTENGESKPSSLSIGYILDNAGFELFTDLCFANALMQKVERIDFHVKEMPWFVSDAMVYDFHWLLESMSNSNDKPVLVRLAQTWKNYLSSGRWTVKESPFWTYPHAFYEMSTVDPNLHSVLRQNTHLIFKGDLNYRKLIGDINWPADTPFKQSIQGFSPSPLMTLRTLKADCVSGLRPGLAEEIGAKNPDWMITGEYGVIQHSK